MTRNNSSVTTRMASQITGYSSRHIQNFIKSGKLSATKDVSGNYLIDKAELYRVFPECHAEKSCEKTKEISQEILESEIKHLKEMNNFLNKQLEISTNERSLLLETLSSNQKLLEYNRVNIKRKKFLGIF